MGKTRRISIKFWLGLVVLVQLALAWVGFLWFYACLHEPGLLFYGVYPAFLGALIFGDMAFCSMLLWLEYYWFIEHGIKKKE